jgi:hypothetical protein
MTLQSKRTTRKSFASHAYSIPVVRELPASPGLLIGSASTW